MWSWSNTRGAAGVDTLHVIGSQPWRVRPTAGVYGSLEQPRPVGPGCELQVLVRREAGGDEVLQLPRGVDGSDDAIAGAGQRAGTFDDLVQDGATLRLALVRSDGGAESGDPLAQCLGRVRSPIQLLRSHAGGAVTSPDAALHDNSCKRHLSAPNIHVTSMVIVYTSVLTMEVCCFTATGRP